MLALPVSARGLLALAPTPKPSAPKPHAPEGPTPTGSAPSKCQVGALNAQQSQAANFELLAVEGASPRLNFVILLAERHSNGSIQGQRHLELGWQRAPESSGHGLPALPARAEPPELFSGGGGGELRIRGRQQLFTGQLLATSEPQLLQQLLARLAEQEHSSSAGATSAAAPGNFLFGASSSSTGQAPQTDATQPDATDAFMRVPYFDERRLARLAQLPAGHLSPLARQQVAAALQRLARPQPHPLAQVDELVADGQQPLDWARLVGLLFGPADHAHFSSKVGVAAGCPPFSRWQQLQVVQFALGPLRLSDRGLYQLFACPDEPEVAGEARSAAAADQRRALESQRALDSQRAPGGQSGASLCSAESARSQLVASLSVQLAEDVPQLQGRFEAQLLEPGERLSIKCEATGFTLPQISWFLDGQPLSESSASPSLHLSNTVPRAPASPSGAPTGTGSGSEGGRVAPGHLRIGDYVSQDNRVHSFVNASSLQVADGGFYKCQANNGFHLVEHEARIDVRGPPTIERPLPANLSVLVGAPKLELQCPFGGHPIAAVEWYFRPASGSGGRPAPPESAGRDYAFGGPARRRRHGPALWWSAASQAADADQEPELPVEPERDEWLAQAAAMTPGPLADDYPEPPPDYPQLPGLLEPHEELAYEEPSSLEAAGLAGQLAADYLAADEDQPGPTGQALLPQARLRRSPMQLFGGQDQQLAGGATGASQPLSLAGNWLKLPQSRRHQLSALNGTLVLHELAHSERGLYKCRALAPDQSATGEPPAEAWSSELHLNVLTPPQISPFSSPESLREGMRNFLTCSVIEGDSPVRLAWFKDQQPLEDYIERASSRHFQPEEQWSRAAKEPAWNQQARIKIDNSNEFTSTVYFSQVELRDSGNYTCM